MIEDRGLRGSHFQGGASSYCLTHQAGRDVPGARNEFPGGRKTLNGFMMRAVEVLEFGGPEVLRLVDVADPVPGPGEVCIQVRACTVNPTDTMRRAGAPAWHKAAPQGPFRLGMEVAGVIDEVGPGADFEVGDQVMALVVPSQDHGAYAERIVLPVQQVALAPRNVGVSHAATVPMNGLTALLALAAVDLPAGATLAVTGAAGAVGGYVVELAKARGLRVIADSAPADEELVRQLGPDWIVPRGHDVAAAIRRLVQAGVLHSSMVQSRVLKFSRQCRMAARSWS